MRVASTDDVSIELHDLGGEGPPLLIAHATGFCTGPYRPMAATLARHFHVWSLDFRAHGDSTVPTGGDLTWRGMADDVLAAVDTISDRRKADAAPDPIHANAAPDDASSESAPVVGITSGGGVVAVGHSMGGAALLEAERRVPGTLRAAYVFEPIVVTEAFVSMVGGNPLAEAARRRRATFTSRPDALARYASRPPLGIFRADVLAAYVEHGFADTADGEVTLRCTPENEAAVFDAGGKPMIDTMGTVEIPTAVACGGSDVGPGPADFAPAVVEALGNGQLRRHRYLTHFGPFQDPDGIARDAIDFLPTT